MNVKIKLGISSCLLGNAVRYDGGHKMDRFLTETFGRYAEYVPVCPEVECGMPVPREPMNLKGDPGSPRLVAVQTRHDLTAQMIRWAEKRVVELGKEGLMGFVFKSDSPSCGMERVNVSNEKNLAGRKGVGLFARLFMNHFPLLPVEDERRFHDPAIRENFIERIFTLTRWRELADANKGSRGLIEFHTKHKLLILAHSAKHYREMGRLVGGLRRTQRQKLYEEYQGLLREALKVRATPKKNVNVLMHIAGYFKAQLSAGEKGELQRMIESYGKERVPLIVPITLINHYISKYDQPYLKDQYYLNPHSFEVQMRNHG